MNELFIGNLPYKLDVDNFRAWLSVFGEVKSLRLVRDAKGDFKGFAFVQMAPEARERMLVSANIAQHRLFGANVTYDGRRIIISEARNRRVRGRRQHAATR